MKRQGGAAASRLRWIGIFCVFLIGISAVPVLAEPGAGEPAGDGLPSAEVFSRALAAGEARLESEAKQHDEELTSPEAQREREASRTAYASISGAQAQSLLSEAFPGQLQELEADPARILSGVEVEKTLGTFAARVSDEEGKHQLLESPIPVETGADGTAREPVDLSLQREGATYEPQAPLTDVQLPDSAAGQIRLQDGISVTDLPGEGDPAAHRFGQFDLFYPDTAADTDTLLSPLAGGLEISEQLRSPQSPESFRYPLTLPQGATLKSTAAGGAEVLDASGNPLALVPPPSAVDSQGKDVPVSLSVEGDALVVEVEHRSLDPAYPLLLDPEVIESAGPSGGGFAKWVWGDSQGSTTGEGAGYLGRTSCILTCFGSGLYARSRAKTAYAANSWGQFVLSVPGGTTAYIRRAVFGPISGANTGTCSTEPQPHGYVGIFNVNSGQYQSIGLYSPLSATQNGTFDSGFVGGPGVRVATMGVGTAASAQSPVCGHDFYLGGATLFLEDPEAPTINSLTGLPGGWIGQGAQVSATVNSSDPGLGVRNVTVSPAGAASISPPGPECLGTIEAPCSTSRSDVFDLSAQLAEGERELRIFATDPTGKVSGVYSTQTSVDRTPPEVTLSGQLARATDETEGDAKDPEKWDELSLPTYNLTITAEDGSLASAAAKRSGVKSIEVFLDKKGTPEQSWTQSCPASSCAMARTFTLNLSALTEGKHVLKIIAKDQLNQARTREIEFEYVPATGMKDEYVLQRIPLPDGGGEPEEGEFSGPEIAVNVTNGNLVYHERDIQTATARAGLELERLYNSQLPAEEDTQWGDGWSVAQAPELEPEGPESPPGSATVVEDSAITKSVELPAAAGEKTFAPELHATIEKVAGGGYDVADQGGGEVTAFSPEGEIEEVRLGEEASAAPGSAAAPPTFLRALGSGGSANGQLAHPAGIALGAGGNLWIVDQSNNRVEGFNEAGEFLRTFGSTGSANGQLNRPTAIAAGPEGELWVLDAGNNRVEEFSEAGEYLAKFGSAGTGNGQLSAAEGLAVDQAGDVWVADTYNARLEEFNGKGEFLKTVGTRGTGTGQLVEPTDVDIGKAGNLWVADWANNKVVEFNSSGAYVRQFGTAGAGNGQFNRPDVLAADEMGNVWVGDQNNGRVQKFNENGEYLAQFGTKGTGAGQFSFGFPMGIAVDPGGHIWVSDTANNRVQEWSIPGYDPSADSPYNAAPAIDYSYSGSDLTQISLEDPVTPGEDPELELSTSGGLTTSVSDGEETVDYGYEAEELVQTESPAGETTYRYDPSGRLERIELPNGTIATIKYDTLSRATEVTVDPAGAEPAKTTKFAYSSEPRRTVVSGGGNPEIVYDVAEDGSVARWSYPESAPQIDSISGSLWAGRGTQVENGTQTLSVTASSPHEISSIQVIADGIAVVAEQNCEDNSNPPAHNCDNATLEWITDSSEHQGGQLNLEVIATDFLGHSSAERFSVTIPPQPAPEAELPEAPAFSATKEFREEFGLDRGKGLSEGQENELVLELLYEWESKAPMAVFAVEEWGVPMRAAEVAELQNRERYVEQDVEAIPAWAEAHAPNAYAGYYVDEQAGGKIYVGFTANQNALVQALKQEAGLLEANQVAGFPTVPTHSLASLEAIEESVAQAVEENESVQSSTVSIGIRPESPVVEVVATNASVVGSYLTQRFGAGAPIETVQGQQIKASGRFRNSGSVRGGDELQSGPQACGNGSSGCVNLCTANFSARDRTDGHRGQPVWNFFILTAGHCFNKTAHVFRSGEKKTLEKTSPVGVVVRRPWTRAGRGVKTDSEAILNDPGASTSEFFLGKRVRPVLGPERALVGATLCWSGISGGVHCGVAKHWLRINLEGTWTKELLIAGRNAAGDSGAPVWNRKTGEAVAILSARGEHHCKTFHPAGRGSKALSESCFGTYVTPLLPRENTGEPPGAMNEMSLDSLILGPSVQPIK